LTDHKAQTYALHIDLSMLVSYWAEKFEHAALVFLFDAQACIADGNSDETGFLAIYLLHKYDNLALSVSKL